jgi:hypothetical protein
MGTQSGSLVRTPRWNMHGDCGARSANSGRTAVAAAANLPNHGLRLGRDDYAHGIAFTETSSSAGALPATWAGMGRDGPGPPAGVARFTHLPTFAAATPVSDGRTGARIDVALATANGLEVARGAIDPLPIVAACVCRPYFRDIVMRDSEVRSATGCLRRLVSRVTGVARIYT